MDGLDSLVTGRIARAIAAIAVISIVTLAVMAAGVPVFGPINDLTNAVGGLLSALLAWQFHALLRERIPGVAVLGLLAAWAGAAAITVNSIRVATGRMHWMTGGMYLALGYGLLGVWLLALLRLIGPQPFLTPGLTRLGIVAGTAMLFGLLAGPALLSGTNLEKNPLAWIASVSVTGGWLIYPLWCWLVGRMLLK